MSGLCVFAPKNDMKALYISKYLSLFAWNAAIGSKIPTILCFF